MPTLRVLESAVEEAVDVAAELLDPHPASSMAPAAITDTLLNNLFITISSYLIKKTVCYYIRLTASIGNSATSCEGVI